MAPKLSVIFRNPSPNRVPSYPRAWLVYSGRTSVTRVLIERNQRKPYVASKRAA